MITSAVFIRYETDKNFDEFDIDIDSYNVRCTTVMHSLAPHVSFIDPVEAIF